MSPKRPGRPPLHASGRMKTTAVRLDRDTLDKAKRLGGGKLSHGVRLAVAAAPEPKPD